MAFRPAAAELEPNMPGRIEKTVFISYRRTNFPWALAVYQDLTHHGYDVFFDYQSIDSGDFEKVIIENIKARAHFLVILTPSALERCREQDDWLRREIETAMDQKRNIVPLMLESFDFGSPLVLQSLPGKLARLRTYNGLKVYSEYFFEAMEKLRERYLNVEVASTKLPSLNLETRKLTKSQKIAASEAAPVDTSQLTAQEWFERGYVFQESKNTAEAIRCFSEAIRLKPEYAEVYNNRGVAYSEINDYNNAIKDYTRSIRLKNPEPHLPYNNRGLARRAQRDFKRAIIDFTKAIKLKPNLAEAYYNRANAYRDMGNLDSAIIDYTNAIRYKPDYANAYFDRALTYQIQGNAELAMKDYQDGMRLKPDDEAAKPSLTNVLRSWATAN